MAKVQDVASYILEKLTLNINKEITTWKLQKLVYYSQAWSLVWDEEPLFDAEIQAWSAGPVCPKLYNMHKGRLKISAADNLVQGDSRNLQDNQIETIDAVIKHYGNKSGRYLSELTHMENPWIEARENLPPGSRSTNVISLNSMQEYYGGL